MSICYISWSQRNNFWLSDSPCCSNSGCGVALESEEKNMNTFQYTTEKTDSFVIDMDSFSSNKDNNTTNANSRIITRSLSRKGSQRGGDRKMKGNATTLHDKDVNVIPPICSPKGSITPEKPAVMAVGPTDHSISPHVHHQIGIIIANSSNNSTNENKGITRRNSFRRTSSSWTLDPKRVLLLFATLSSMGTIVLIYFTFIINKQNGDHEYGGD